MHLLQFFYFSFQYLALSTLSIIWLISLWSFVFFLWCRIFIPLCLVFRSILVTSFLFVWSRSWISNCFVSSFLTWNFILIKLLRLKISRLLFKFIKYVWAKSIFNFLLRKHNLFSTLFRWFYISILVFIFNWVRTDRNFFMWSYLSMSISNIDLHIINIVLLWIHQNNVIKHNLLIFWF